MVHQDGIRQGERTKQNIVTALTQRLRTTTYQQVTVGDLMRQAAVGRSTFYRHFTSKLDVLLLHHCNRFSQMLEDYQTESAWLADHASPSLHQFFEKVSANSNLRRSLGYTLGADSELAKHKITQLIVSQVENSLRTALPLSELQMPLPVLSAAIAANIQSQVVAFKELTNRNDTAAFVNQLQRLNRGLILAALNRI
ncbi:TetR/AcrR family transcriptional regulator [Ferrimonas balearica]|uniref:TetR/AcrR family transcriptional regulator n=1 Tax=Ferrimonas balearica TaxID=44012 RepID=UPI001C994DCA|nr:TetR/AcrR family transcriptional regulator [Ferrimonas balearica]MBY5920800.1 TetR/AcrR family transcriptional regulator [Ferrimonas balearica]MBY5996515.1 TetR/AcrR family transcriptional regulator [Ferrimonas balearica]